MTNILISIITPTYNRGKEILKTINSVLNQTYKDIEFLIIDDGSNDDTVEWIKTVKDKRIRLFHQNHSGIPAKGRNRGIKEARGDYIAFIDHDDLWYPNKLELQMNFFQQNSSLVIVATNGYYHPKINPVILPIKKNVILLYEKYFFSKNNPVMNSSVLIRKNIFDKIGLLDDSIGNYLPDRDFWLRTLKYRDESILILRTPLFIRTIHGTNLSSFYEKSPKGIKEAYRRMLYILKKHEAFGDCLLETPVLKKIRYRYALARLKQLIYLNEIKFLKVLSDRRISFLNKLGLLELYFVRNGIIRQDIFLKSLKRIIETIKQYLFNGYSKEI